MVFGRGPKASAKWKDAREESHRPVPHILRDMKKHNPHLTRKQCVERYLDQLKDTENDREIREQIRRMRHGRQVFCKPSQAETFNSAKKLNVGERDHVTKEEKEERLIVGPTSARDAKDWDIRQILLTRSHVKRHQSHSKAFLSRAVSPNRLQPVRFGLTKSKGLHMDRVKGSAAGAGPQGGVRGGRGRAEDFFDSAGKTGEPSTKDVRSGRRSRSKSPAVRDSKRGNRERSTSPRKGLQHKGSGRRDTDDTRVSGRYERNRSRDRERNHSRERDRRYRSRSRDRMDRRRERSHSGDRDRGGRVKERYRDKGGDYERDRNDKRLLERGGGREGRHSPRRGTPKLSSSRRSASPPPVNSPRHNIRIRSPIRKDDKRGNDARKDMPIPSIESPNNSTDNMDISEDKGEDNEEDLLQRQMKAIMGFGNFNTTKNKKVPGNNVYGIRKEKKTEYRQYMNRVGGFNRALSPS